MPPCSNLICESLLIAETIDFLVSVGGAASAASVVDYVMRISKPEPGVARILALELVERDPRLALTEDTVRLFEPDHSAIPIDETEYVVFDLETTGAKAPPCRITEIGPYRVSNFE